MYSSSRRGREECQCLRPARKKAPQEALGIKPDEVLGQIIGLRHEQPLPISERHLVVHAGKGLAHRNDVQHGQLADRGGRVQGHAIGHATAAIVSGDEEPFVSKALHDLELVGGERPLRIRRVPRIGRRLGAIAVARRSVATTEKCCARIGATACHIAWV